MTTHLACAITRCGRSAVSRVRMIPDGGAARQTGVVLVCAGHVSLISKHAGRIMAAVQASREALVADRYRVEIEALEEAS